MPTARPRRAARKKTCTAFPCPECKGHRLYVVTVRNPAPGVVVRYRKCSACGHKVVTEERLAKGRVGTAVE